jgi:hypothetical protein
MCNSVGNVFRLGIVVASLVAVGGFLVVFVVVDKTCTRCFVVVVAWLPFFPIMGCIFCPSVSLTIFFVIVTWIFFPFFSASTFHTPKLGCQFLVMFNCDFIQFGDANYASIGLWYYGVDGTCADEELSLEAEGWYSGAWISASRGCLILSMFCGAGATGMVLLEWLCCEICCAGIAEGLAYAAAWGLGLYVVLFLFCFV